MEYVGSVLCSCRNEQLTHYVSLFIWESLQLMLNSPPNTFIVSFGNIFADELAMVYYVPPFLTKLYINGSLSIPVFV